MTHLETGLVDTLVKKESGLFYMSYNRGRGKIGPRGSCFSVTPEKVWHWAVADGAKSTIGHDIQAPPLEMIRPPIRRQIITLKCRDRSQRRRSRCAYNLASKNTPLTAGLISNMRSYLIRIPDTWYPANGSRPVIYL